MKGESDRSASGSEASFLCLQVKPQVTVHLLSSLSLLGSYEQMKRITISFIEAELVIKVSCLSLRIESAALHLPQPTLHKSHFT